MCGIFGMAGKPLRENRTYHGEKLIKHRGPDSFGHWVDELVQLEHRRLSIIDLSPGGDQPYFLNDRYVLIYNGEIFNYLELKKNLSSTVTLRSTSDTEILYYLLMDQGLQCLNQLNGMFAFAFYDKLNRKLFLVRDRYGVKPLYYSANAEGLIFASEQKAIYPLIKPTTDLDRFSEYLAFKYVSGAKTFVNEVQELEPGCFIEYDLITNSFKKQAWYQLPTERQNNTPYLNQYCEGLIQDAVSLRLISDVPVGVQLSGGVDSSIIAELIRRASTKVAHAFTISFPGSKFDELKYATEVAQKMSLELHAIEFKAVDFLSIWEAATYHNDEPINHPHTLPIYKLNQEAKKFVTVLLSGEGADETFLGYEHHFKTLNFESDAELLNFGRFLKKEQVREILKDEYLSQSASEYGERPESLRASFGKGNRAERYEFHHHLNTLLNRIDKMSMAHAMEIRTPFLDYRIVDFCLRENAKNFIELETKTVTKKPLMNLYESIYKNGLSARKKIGFRVPFNEWILTDKQFQDYVCAHLDPLKQDQFVRTSKVQILIESIGRAELTEDKIREIWVLMNYALWKKAFLGVTDRL